MLGGTLMDVSKEENGIRERQILTERFTGTWSLSYTFLKNKISADYTGNIYGPMRLPLLGPLDPRPGESPWWSIQNLQFTYKGLPHFEIYAGVKKPTELDTLEKIKTNLSLLVVLIPLIKTSTLMRLVTY